MKKRFLSMSLILIGLISSAGAQFYQDSWTLGPNWAFSRAMSDIEIARLAKQAILYERESGKPSSVTTTTRKVVATGPTSFKPTKETILPEVMADSLDGSPQEKQQYKAFLNEAISVYEKDAVNNGYPSNDLAYALAMYFHDNYAVYQSIRPVYPNWDGEMQYLVSWDATYSFYLKDIYAQLLNSLKDQESLKKMNDQQKQMLVEYFAVTTYPLYLNYKEEEAKRPPDMKKINEVKLKAAKNVESFVGADVDRIRVGSKGIEVVK